MPRYLGVDAVGLAAAGPAAALADVAAKSLEDSFAVASLVLSLERLILSPIPCVVSCKGP